MTAITRIHWLSLIQRPSETIFNVTKTPTLAPTQVFEDNEACIVLAHSETTKVCTMHIALKWHHFKDQIKQGIIKVIKIHTNFNWADTMTKPLGWQKHESLQKLIMGW